MGYKMDFYNFTLDEPSSMVLMVEQSSTLESTFLLNTSCNEILEIWLLYLNPGINTHN